MSTGLQELKLTLNAIHKAAKNARDLGDCLELASDVADFKDTQDVDPQSGKSSHSQTGGTFYDQGPSERVHCHGSDKNNEMVLNIRGDYFPTLKAEYFNSHVGPGSEVTDRR